MSRVRPQSLVVLIVTLGWLAGVSAVQAQQPWSVSRKAPDWDRAFWTVPGAEEKIKAAGNLGGWVKQGDWFGLSGWAEYEIEVPQTGWYELLVQPYSSGGGMEYFIDGQKRMV